MLGTNDQLSLELTEKKLADAKRAGAQYLATACTFCQIQFATAQEAVESQQSPNHQVPPILYPQLLGLCMGIDKKMLGLQANQIDIRGIENFL